MATRPVNRIKHVVDSSATLTAGTTLPLTIANAVDAPVLANTTECVTGSKINGIYLKVEVASNETDVGAIPNVYLSVFKNQGGAQTFPAPNVVGASNLKRFVIHQEMIMLNNVAGGNPRILFNGVIAIPKMMRRMGPADALQMNILSPAVNITLCRQIHYKEFR